MIKVLQLDDNRGVRSTLAKYLLSKPGVTVESVEKPGDLRKIDWRKPPYDLVLTDNQMPGKTGVQLIREIRAVNSSIPVVLLTGDNLEDLHRDNPDLGDLNITVASKPIRLHILKPLIAPFLAADDKAQKSSRSFP